MISVFPAMPTKHDTGVIYILENRDRSLSKIGLTRLGSPAGRAAGYTKTYGIEWRTYWSAPTRDVGRVEAAIHRELHAHRFPNAPLGAREIFYVLPQHARAIAQKHIIPPDALLPWRLRIDRKALGTALRQVWAWAVVLAVLAAIAHG
jgi:hypothetical protein